MTQFVLFDCPSCENVEKLTQEGDDIWFCTGCEATLREHRDATGMTVDLEVIAA